MAKSTHSSQETFTNFMTHVVLHHRQGDSALASAAGWIAAAHAIRVGSASTEWETAAEEIAACLEQAYWEGVGAYEIKKGKAPTTPLEPEQPRRTEKKGGAGGKSKSR